MEKLQPKERGSGFESAFITANIMARSGSTYEDIINKFYSGVSNCEQIKSYKGHCGIGSCNNNEERQFE